MMKGYVAGTYNPTANVSHAFLWNKSTFKDLGTLGGPSSSSMAINASHQVLGTSTTASGENHIFLHDGTAMRDITTIARATYPGPITDIEAVDLNDLGYIALNIATETGSIPAVYKKGRIVTVRHMLSDDGFEIGGHIAAINDFGQVLLDRAAYDGMYIATPISLLFQRLWDATVNFSGVHTTEGAAWTAYANYDVKTSDTQLAKFIKDVNTLVAQKKLSTVLGTQWVADANAIRLAMKG